MDWNYFCVAVFEIERIVLSICFKLHPCFCYVLTKLHNLSKCVTLILTLIVEFLLLGLSEICWKKLVLWSWNWYSFCNHILSHFSMHFFYRYPVEILLKKMGRRAQIKTDSPRWQLTGQKRFLAVPLVLPWKICVMRIHNTVTHCTSIQSAGTWIDLSLTHWNNLQSKQNYLRSLTKETSM